MRIGASELGNAVLQALDARKLEVAIIVPIETKEEDVQAPNVMEVGKAVMEALEECGIEVVPKRPAVDAKDQSAHACPHCRALMPKIGVASTVYELNGEKYAIATLFCGECRTVFNVQILEVASAAIQAQERGLVPPGGRSPIWTPGGRSS